MFPFPKYIYQGKFRNNLSGCRALIKNYDFIKTNTSFKKLKYIFKKLKINNKIHKIELFGIF
ncbi:Hypothetical protein Ccan_00580 [Capnocytophaga canimorsus Cc5]|uniref:Uncharacterized protein n=1 Tax=Capnocytophaga canimorsus (strain 5) TaxID=860228 RepID=F9YPT6_CAPCC|nr:Hypothetical protein Ccan_00580 [Capnocytophaga canimorsus Cc5]